MPATIEDLYRESGKAEIVNGEIVRFPPVGGMPGYAGDEIMLSLRDHAKARKIGLAVGGAGAFRTDLPNRASFSPSAAYYTGPRAGMFFFERPPDFDREVRCESDYGEAVEQERAAKRRDYFAAGTLVVWDVDLLDEIVIHKYSADTLDSPTLFRRGDIAEAEPAVPGWMMPVDDLFNEDDIDALNAIASSD